MVKAIFQTDKRCGQQQKIIDALKLLKYNSEIGSRSYIHAYGVKVLENNYKLITLNQINDTEDMILEYKRENAERTE
jgi:hypothetical protein